MKRWLLALCTAGILALAVACDTREIEAPATIPELEACVKAVDKLAEMDETTVYTDDITRYFRECMDYFQRTCSQAEPPVIRRSINSD